MKRLCPLALAAVICVPACIGMHSWWDDDSFTFAMKSPDAVPQRTVVPPPQEPPFDAERLVGLRPEEAIRCAEANGQRACIVGDPAPPPAPGRPDADRWGVILLEIEDGKVTKATFSQVLSGGT
jgi:hypothetical protein